MLSAEGIRDTLIKRYDNFVKETLEEEGMSDISEFEEEDASDMKASENPSLVMIDDQTGNKCMRMVDQKGLGKEGEMSRLIRDMHEELKSWGRPRGATNALIMKSDGEPAIVAVRDALARCHGGRVAPEHPPRGEHQANGLAEVTGRHVRDHARVLK